MLDTCRITKPGTPTGPIDPTTLRRTDPTPVTVYEGACRLGRVDVPMVAQAVAGEAAWDTQDFVLHLPMAGTAEVAANQTVQYLTSVTNPALEGHVFGLMGVLASSQATARRCRVREVTGD